MAQLLTVSNVRKSFGGVQALKDVSFDVKRGEIIGLIGPNGAGKTTLFNIIAGVYKPDSGSVVFKDVKVMGLRPHQICGLGIARTFQLVKPFYSLTVLENVLVASRFGIKGKVRKGWDFAEHALTCLEFAGFSAKRHIQCGSLNLGEMKRVELARALATQPELLLLDEVMAGLNSVEIAEMMRLIERIRYEWGITVFMIEHVMKAIMGVSDRVIVLHHGEVIATGSPRDVVQMDGVIEAYLGGENIQL